MFLVWFGFDLFVNDLVWYYWGQVRSDMFYSWCDLVSFGVVWCDFYKFFVLMDVFCRGSGVIWFWVIWCDMIEVRLGPSWFVFLIVWCRFLLFCEIFSFSCVNRCFVVWFGFDLVLNELVWYYWYQIRSEFFYVWCDLVSFRVVWCDLYNFFYW